MNQYETRHPSWDELVETHRRSHAMSDEQSEAIWRRIVETTNGAASKLLIVRRRAFDEMHDQVIGNILLAKPPANDGPSLVERVVQWWRRLWLRDQRGDPRA